MSQLRVSKRGVIYLVVVVITIIAGYQLIKLYSHNPEKEEGYSMEKVISNDGTEISFLRRGNGPPLILVHGTTADHTRWLPIIPHFEKEFTVYAMDRRGRGESGDSPNYHIMREAEDIAAVVKAIDDPVYLLGHSYGGLVALEAALLTDNIKKLILYEPPVPAGKPFYPPGVPDKMQPLIDNGEFESALEIFLKEVVKCLIMSLKSTNSCLLTKNEFKLYQLFQGKRWLKNFILFDPINLPACKSRCYFY